jgi:ribosomal protein S12 methylthiotransferase accessory factor
MIDVIATLRPATGLALWFGVARPQPPVDLLWRTVVDLDAAGADEPPSARRAGAYGASRADCLMRGAGEAVERAALHPARGPLAGLIRRRLADLGRPALAAHEPRVALAAPESADQELTWYPARRLRDGAEVLVPAALVDWPCAEPEARWFDPGPSGTAAGAGYEMALRNALLEVIERDAIMVAWQRGLRLRRVAHPSTAAFGSLVDVVAAAGLRFGLAEIPIAVPGVFCHVGVVHDETGPAAMASVGCTASGDPVRSALGALQEALQVRAVLWHGRDSGGYTERPARIVTEDDRVAFLLSRDAVALIGAWASSFEAGPAVRSAAVGSDLDGIVAGLLADGADPLAVDLTSRLPAALRAMGWAAVKVIPVGYQALRMSEEPAWSWHRGRLASAESRTGLVAEFDGAGDRRPHPLP